MKRLDDLERIRTEEMQRESDRTRATINEARAEATRARLDEQERARREGKRAAYFNIALTIISIAAGWLLSYLIPLPH